MFNTGTYFEIPEIVVLEFQIFHFKFPKNRQSNLQKGIQTLRIAENMNTLRKTSTARGENKKDQKDLQNLCNAQCDKIITTASKEHKKTIAGQIVDPRTKPDTDLITASAQRKRLSAFPNIFVFGNLEWLKKWSSGFKRIPSTCKFFNNGLQEKFHYGFPTKKDQIEIKKDSSMDAKGGFWYHTFWNSASVLELTDQESKRTLATLMIPIFLGGFR